MRRIFVPILFTVLAPISQAVVWADDITDATVLAFGDTARFKGVGLVSTGGTGTYIGTGNGSGWIITANHVLDINEASTFVVPAYGTFNITGAWTTEDITVARITSSNASLLSGVYTPKLNTKALVAGTQVVSAGFGYSGPQNSNSYNPYDGRRRGFQSVSLGTTVDFSGTYVVDRFDRPGDPNKRAIEAFGAPGDSGSSYQSEADGTILGVLTGGDPEYYGGMNYYSALRPVVSQNIYAFTGINPVPEPATMAVLGLGVAATLRRRKRS